MRAISLDVKDSSGVAVYDPLFDGARSLRKSSQYPGGLYGIATFTIPRDPGTQPSLLRAGHELTISLWDEEMWAMDKVYHGFVVSLEEIKRAGEFETRVTCVGAWGWYMERYGIQRNWADTRISTAAWLRDEGASGAELATDDRDNRIRITPKGVAWTSGNQYFLTYQTPTGELVGKLTCNYDMQEGAQAWELALWNGAADEFSITASGTGSQDVDLGTSTCQLYFEAKLTQTPTEDGTYYGDVSSVIVYASRDHASATLGTVNVYQIALDIVDLLGVDVTLISANLAELDSTLTLSLVPFITNGWETFAAILARAAGYGASSTTAIGFGLRAPFLAPDNKPRLFLETYPGATDYEYEASIDELDLSLRLNLDDVYNYIIVEYTNVNGITKTLTPDDNAALTDADSVTDYGTRALPQPLKLPLANTQQALNYGTRFLERHKQPTYTVTRPVVVTQLTGKAGELTPAALIDAGKRLRIVDLPGLIGDDTPTGKTFTIVKTDYNHDAGTVSLSLGGRPDSLLIQLAQMTLAAS